MHGGRRSRARRARTVRPRARPLPGRPVGSPARVRASLGWPAHSGGRTTRRRRRDSRSAGSDEWSVRWRRKNTASSRIAKVGEKTCSAGSHPVSLSRSAARSGKPRRSGTSLPTRRSSSGQAAAVAGAFLDPSPQLAFEVVGKAVLSEPRPLARPRLAAVRARRRGGGLMLKTSVRDLMRPVHCESGLADARGAGDRRDHRAGSVRPRWHCRAPPRATVRGGADRVRGRRRASSPRTAAAADRPPPAC